jgi:dipeptidyl aminopeptidase/acylaminoacyl peptidase
MVHGGPAEQARRDYSPNTQHLVNHGYVVLAVNNRVWAGSWPNPTRLLWGEIKSGIQAS